MKTRLLLLSCMLGLSSVYAETNGTAEIDGQVLSENGTPLANARVVAVQKVTQLPDGKQLLGGDTARTVSDQDGRFSFTGLQPGSYHVCAYGVARNNAGACEWKGVPLTKVSQGERVELTRDILDGVILTVNVLSSNVDVRPEDLHFRIGTSGQQVNAEAKLVSRRSSSLTYEVAFPRGRKVDLFVQSSRTLWREQEIVHEGDSIVRPVELPITGLIDQTVTFTVK